ncbi:MAG: MarR family transcriptional regulator [Pseudomonadota bacterium]
MNKKQTNPPSAPDDDYGLVRACRRLHAAIDEMDEKTARALGVSRNDLRCLNLLENGPVTPKFLVQSLGLTSGSITSLLDRLEAREFIERAPHPEDRRALLVELRPKAFAEIGAIYRTFGAALVALAHAYSARNAEQAVGHLNDVARVCEEVTQQIGS